MPRFELDDAINCFATEGPPRPHLERAQLASSEQAIDGGRVKFHRGMELEEIGEFSHRDDVSSDRRSCLVCCQNSVGSLCVILPCTYKISYRGPTRMSKPKLPVVSTNLSSPAGHQVILCAAAFPIGSSTLGTKPALTSAVQS